MSTELLQQNYILRRRYRIVRMLGRGEYSAVYEAFDAETRRAVAVKEFFPARLSRRAEDSDAISPLNRECGTQFFLGSEAFLNQYNALRQAAGSRSVVAVCDAFFENGTSYAVMEKLTGATLQECLAVRRQRLNEGEAVFLLQSLSEALLVIHSLSMLHGAVTTENVFVCTDGSVKLIGFSAARDAIRQQRKSAELPRAQSDIRALGAMVCEELTGRPTPSDPSPLYAQMSGPLADLISRMLSSDEKLQFDSVFALLHALNCIEINPETIRIPLRTPERPAVQERAPEAERPRSEKERPRRSNLRSRVRAMFVVGGVLLVLLITLIIVLATRG